MPPNLDSLAKFKSSGQLFNYSPATNLFNVAGDDSVAYASPFSFKAGGTTTSTLYVKEDAIVSFGQSLASGFSNVANLDQNSRTAIGAGFAGVIIQQGIADPFAASIA